VHNHGHETQAKFFTHFARFGVRPKQNYIASGTNLVSFVNNLNLGFGFFFFFLAASLDVRPPHLSSSR
jgi:hypothetical protein